MISYEFLEELSAIRLVLMDVDGTLVTGNRETLDNVLTQLRRLKMHNVWFSVATGRSLTGVATVLDRFRSVHARAVPLIAYNGAVLAIPGAPAIIERNVISRPVLNPLLDVLSSSQLPFLVYTCDSALDLTPKECVFSSDRELATSPEFNGMNVSYLRRCQLEQLDNAVAVLGIADSPDRAREIAKEIHARFLTGIRITTSGRSFVEIAGVASTKLHAMLRLSAILHVAPSQILAIGDSYNDVEMLCGAGFGVAVANAPAEVKEAAQFVCSRSAGEGVVEIIRILLEAQRFARMERRVVPESKP